LKQKHWGYLFVLPFFLGVLVFQAYPLIDTIKTSFTNENFSQFNVVPQFVGLKNYVRELGSMLLAKAVLNTLIVAGLSLVIQFILSLAVVAILTNPDLAIRRTWGWLVAFFLPSQLSVSALTLYLISVLSPVYSVLPQVFSQGWFCWIVLSTCVIFLGFGITSYFMVNTIRALPKPLFEAAHVAGASGGQIFWHISLPQLKPLLVFLVIISLILNLCLFDLPFALFPPGSSGQTASLGSNGGPGQAGLTIGTYAYQRAFLWDTDLGSGSAVSILLFGLIALISAFYFRLMKKTQDEFSVLQ